MKISNKILMAGAAGVAGGLIGSIFVLPLLLRVNFLNTATILSKLITLPQTPTIINKTEDQPAIVIRTDYFSEAINKVQPSIVAVQFFSGDALLRHGSGAVLTQDGLIATLNSVIPTQAGVIQVTGDGKIYKAKIISRDYKSNIAIISITAENNLQVVRLNSELPGLGQKLLVLAKRVNFGKDSPIVAEALVSRLDEINKRFYLSIGYDEDFYGGAIVDNNGTMLGMLDFRNQKPVVIQAKAIEETLTAGLTKTRSP